MKTKCIKVIPLIIMGIGLIFISSGLHSFANGNVDYENIIGMLIGISLFGSTYLQET